MWIPLLKDNLRFSEKLNSKTAELCEALIATSSKESGLMRGEAGIILSLFYYSRIYKDNNVRDCAVKRLDNLIDAFQEASINETFSMGISGIGWTLLHLNEKKFISISIDTLDDIDQHLKNSIESQIQSNNFDYLHGFIGVGLYFLKRGKNGRGMLERIVEGLYSMSIQLEDGSFKWEEKITHEKPIYNLSLSHGMTGIVLFLLKVLKLRQFSDHSKINLMLKGAIKYILNQKFDESGFHSCFPPAGELDTEELFKKNSRLSWCYGDLGIALALYNGGKAFNEPNWCDIAINTYKINTGRRTYDSTAVMDAAFCHGSSGIAYMYSKFYNYEANLTFKECSAHWIQVSLEQGKNKDGIAGFQTFYGAYGWKNELGLLEGIAGIMLTYMSMIHPEVPDWDECLLLR